MVIVRKVYQKLIFAFALVLLLTTPSSDTFAKSWRGITPLHSTGEDVRRLFPACEETETRCQFTVEDQEVMVIFSGSNIGVLKCNRVPKATVLAVIVTFRFGGLRELQELKLKRERVTTFDSSDPPRGIYKAYYYARAGFIINTFEGKAFQLAYIAAQKDIPLCPEYYDDPKGFVAIGAGHERLP